MIINYSPCPGPACPLGSSHTSVALSSGASSLGDEQSSSSGIPSASSRSSSSSCHGALPPSSGDAVLMMQLRSAPLQLSSFGLMDWEVCEHSRPSLFHTQAVQEVNNAALTGAPTPRGTCVLECGHFSFRTSE